MIFKSALFGDKIPILGINIIFFLILGLNLLELLPQHPVFFIFLVQEKGLSLDLIVQIRHFLDLLLVSISLFLELALLLLKLDHFHLQIIALHSFLL